MGTRYEESPLEKFGTNLKYLDSSDSSWGGDRREGASGLAAKRPRRGRDVRDAKAAYAALENGVNEHDGREVRFVKSTLGKILRHRGYDTARLVPHLKVVFDAALPMGFEAERETQNRADGTPHKAHRNFVGYHNYLGKITDGGKHYYVRFTVQELKTRSQDFLPNEVHSTFVSDVSLYDEADALALDTAKGAGKVGAVGFVDSIVAKRLADFKRARDASSKVVDENGEPLGVYHGSKNEIVRNIKDSITRHSDHEGTRALVGIMPDNTIGITGSEIDADDSSVAKQRAAELAPRPHVRSEEVIRALKKRFSSDGDIVAQTALEAQP